MVDFWVSDNESLCSIIRNSVRQLVTYLATPLPPPQKTKKVGPVFGNLNVATVDQLEIIQCNLHNNKTIQILTPWKYYKIHSPMVTEEVTPNCP
jgi:hypothetical protein